MAELFESAVKMLSIAANKAFINTNLDQIKWKHKKKQ